MGPWLQNLFCRVYIYWLFQQINSHCAYHAFRPNDHHQEVFRYQKRKSEDGGKKISRSEFIKKAGLATGALVFGTLTLGMFKWVYDFNVIRKKVHLPNLPNSFEGFRIVQLSDIHLGSWVSENEFSKAIETVNGLNPDIILFTGDLVNYSTDEAFRFENILNRLSAPFGVFCTLGNHDYGDYKRWDSPEEKDENMNALFRLYERVGWKLLRNQNEILHKDGSHIALLGVENWGSMKRFQNMATLIKPSSGPRMHLLNYSCRTILRTGS